MTTAVADEALLAALVSAAKPRLGEFSAQDLADIAFGFAKAGQWDARLFEALA